MQFKHSKFFVVIMLLLVFTSCAKVNESDASENKNNTSYDAITDSEININEKTNTSEVESSFIYETNESSEIVKGNENILKLKYTPTKPNNENQKKLSDYLYSNIDEKAFKDCILSNLTEANEINIDISEDEYEISCDEFYTDFDLDGTNEMFAYLYIQIFSTLPDMYYRELWYTDGLNVEKVTSSTGRFAISGFIDILSGKPMVYIVQDISMPSNIQDANCYILDNGNPNEYILSDENKYFAFYKSGENYEKFNVFIGFRNNYNNEVKCVTEAISGNTIMQTYDWIDNEIEITSGYGFE